MNEIYKVAGVIVRDRKLLVVRTRGKPTFYAPGGKPETGEEPLAALTRELKEELTIDVQEDQLEPFGTYQAEAADDNQRMLTMDAFIVKEWRGEIQPSAEIEEIKWVTAEQAKHVKLGSIFQTKIAPKLHANGVID